MQVPLCRLLIYYRVPQLALGNRRMRRHTVTMPRGAWFGLLVMRSFITKHYGYIYCDSDMPETYLHDRITRILIYDSNGGSSHQAWHLQAITIARAASEERAGSERPSASRLSRSWTGRCSSTWATGANPGARLEPGVAQQRIEPDQAAGTTAAAARPRRPGGGVLAIEAVGDQQHDAPWASTRRDQVR